MSINPENSLILAILILTVAAGMDFAQALLRASARLPRQVGVANLQSSRRILR